MKPTARYYCPACGTSSAGPGDCPSGHGVLARTQEQESAPALTTRTAIATLKVPALNDNAQAEISWHWCPDCHIASGKPGDCPTCSQPFVPVPSEGLPYGPYAPRRAGKRSKAMLVMPLLTIAALVIYGLFGFLLYRLGEPTSSPSGSSDGLVHTTAHTSVHLPELGTVNLPGTWIADPITQSSLQTSLDSGGGSGQVLAVERSGQTILWLASIVKSPGGGGGGGAGADPCTYTPLGNATPTIASHQAESSDVKSVCPTGTTYSREYDMKDTGATLVLKVISPVSVSVLNTIQTALLELPSSNTGGVVI